ncbi:hypothetical protein [Oryzifoliimicrobium ureilyticus]|uniref:hypothetical protein n=1 Tax=Oryzifoliimicrobium ureilyticus TaxID=3113724 RepID=UPI0030764DC4
MTRRVFFDYAFYWAPAIIFPGLLFFFSKSVQYINLFKIGLTFPLCLLAIKGLMVHFPLEQRHDRSLARTAEYSVCKGMIVAAFWVLLMGFMTDPSQQTFAVACGEFMLMTVSIGTVRFLVELKAQRMLRSATAD